MAQLTMNHVRTPQINAYAAIDKSGPRQIPLLLQAPQTVTSNLLRFLMSDLLSTVDLVSIV
jgi:hypothetical protein